MKSRNSRYIDNYLPLELEITLITPTSLRLRGIDPKITLEYPRNLSPLYLFKRQAKVWPDCRSCPTLPCHTQDDLLCRRAREFSRFRAQCMRCFRKRYVAPCSGLTSVRLFFYSFVTSNSSSTHAVPCKKKLNWQANQNFTVIPITRTSR